MFSDNCAAQNKNHTIVQYLFTLVQQGRFQTITHMFPEPGHSFLPCDRSFGLVESQKRKHERLCVPQDWHKVVRDSSKEFEVVPVSQDMLKNFSECYQSCYKKLLKNARNVKFMISTYRLFQYNVQYKQVIRCSESLNATQVFDFPIMQKSSSSSLSYQKLYSQPLKIKAAKYKDVIKLARQYVPPADMTFYESLMCMSNTPQPETSDSDNQ